MQESAQSFSSKLLDWLWFGLTAILFCLGVCIAIASGILFAVLSFLFLVENYLDSLLDKHKRKMKEKKVKRIG